MTQRKIVFSTSHHAHFSSVRHMAGLGHIVILPLVTASPPLGQEQKIRLLQLVPDLQALSVKNADMPEEQIKLVTYFQAKMEQLPQRTPLQTNDIFVGDLTVAEFFTLPEEEQDRVWQDAHRQFETYTLADERPVQADALPS